MAAPRKVRRGYFRLRMLGAILCTSVFAWGFQAKISLYHPAAPLNPEHVAKLMADSQGTKGSAGAICGHGSVVARTVWIVFSPVAPRRRTARHLRIDRLLHPAVQAQTHALFFRPPPQIV